MIEGALQEIEFVLRYIFTAIAHAFENLRHDQHRLERISAMPHDVFGEFARRLPGFSHETPALQNLQQIIVE